MAEDLHLPFDLLDDGFFAGGDGGARVEQGECLAGLTRRMAESFLHNEELSLERPVDLRHRSRHREHGLVIQPRRPTPGEISSILFAHYRMQAARFLQLKQQQQLVQHELSEALKGLSDSSKGVRNVYNSSHSGWPPHHIQHQPHPGSGMRAMFLRGSSARKESIGTGVFLPRTAGSKAESQKNMFNCIDSGESHSGFELELGRIRRTDDFAGRRKPVRNHSRSKPEPAAMRSNISSLPQEWTY